MCGISGAIGFVNPQIQDAVKTMSQNLNHRGPDMQGYWSNVEYSATTDTGLVLAHNRLAIIDLSESGAQPMYDESGNVLVYNGEFYNYQSARLKLSADGATFNSESDTEILLKLLAMYGMDSINRVNGMFAFAFWNESQNKLTLARDRMGIKPLYYTYIENSEGQQTLLFASEVRALLSTNLISRRFEPLALETYLWNGYVSGESSIVKNVHLLGAGEYLTVTANGRIEQKSKYWELNNASRLSSFESCKEKFFDSVNRRLVADVPLGIFLSGGIDSSAIASITSQLQSGDIHTFNVGFPDEEYDESRYAVEVANHLGTTHTSLKLLESDFIDNLPAAMNSIDQPTFDAINTYFVSKSVKEAGITVALSGAGGDELFGGYTSFRDVPKMIKVGRYNRFIPDQLLRTLQRMINKIMYGSGDSLHSQVRWGKLYDTFKTNGELLKAFQISYALFTQETLKKIQPDLNFNNYGLTNDYSSYLQSHTQNGRLLQNISYLELMTFISQRLLRDTDAASMAVALEVRVPFMDHEFIEETIGLEPNLRYNPLGSKSFIRKAALSNLPHELFQRPKSGFVLPFDKWLKNKLQDTIEATFNDRELCEGAGLNQSIILRLLAAYQSGSKGIYWSRIWSLYVLLAWSRQHDMSLS